MAASTSRRNKHKRQEAVNRGPSRPTSQKKNNRRPHHESPDNAGYTSPSWRPADPAFREMFNPSVNQDGSIFVNENVALNFSAIYSAVTLIAGQIATMPIRILRRDSANPKNRVEVFDHPACRILCTTPDGETPSGLFKEASQAHILLTGNTYSEIIRNNRGQAIDLHLLDPHRVDPFIDQLTGKRGYHVTGANGVNTLRADQIFHIPALTWNGLTGLSPIKLARDTIALGIYAEKYGLKFYDKGGRPMGFLTKPGVIGDPQRKQYRQEWKELHEGIANWFSVGILSGGLEWKNIGVTPDEAQFLSTRQFQIEEVCRWFHVPPHMLAQMGKSTSENFQHMMLEFCLFTLMPWIKRWEGELNMKLFTRVEQNIYRVVFNMDGILRADPKTRTEIYEKQVKSGGLTVNEWRDLEDRNAFGDCGDKPMVLASQVAPLVDVEKGTNLNSPLKQQLKPEKEAQDMLDAVFSGGLAS